MLRTFNSQWAGFRHAGVIEQPRSPGALDAFSRRRDAAAGFARDNQLANQRAGQVDALALRYFRQAEGIGGRTQNDGRLVVEEEAQAGAAAESAAGQTQTPHARGCLERGPEAEERTKRERKEQPIARPDAGH